MKGANRNSLSDRIYQAGESLLQAVKMPGSKIAESLNNTLRAFLPWPFMAGSARLTDDEGNVKEFESVIYVTSAMASETVPIVDRDAIACVLHVVGSLGPDQLREGYERIAVVNRLKRTRIESLGYPLKDGPSGIILAIDTDFPIEKIAEQMLLLNERYPSNEWPDMVAILRVGTINYAVAFPGEEKMGGDFFLPDRNSLSSPPMYIHLVARGLGLFAMNKMCAFLFVSLQAFSPGSKLPDPNEILEGVPTLGININSYQFNLKGELVPSRNLLWEQGKIGPVPFRIEDNEGNLLSHIEFMPWQDGGILRLTGKLPWDGILVFLGPAARNLRVVTVEPDAVISYVLPIGDAEFRELLGRIQRQTNMRVRPEQPGGVMSKWGDEGSTSPFMARLLMGMLNLRDTVFADIGKRKEFDVLYQFVFETTVSTRAASKQITQLLNEHSRKVSNGEIAHLRGAMIRLDEDIHSDLQRFFGEFLNSAVRVIKDGMQKLTMFLGLDIGLLYKRQGAYEKGIAEIAITRPELSAYLEEIRKWSEELIALRNRLHEGWTLPKITYKANRGTIYAVEPEISGRRISVFVGYILDRLCCFLEELTAYCLQNQMPAGISITEIPLHDRKPEYPARFHVTLTHGGSPIWRISYHNSAFEET